MKLVANPIATIGEMVYDSLDNQLGREVELCPNCAAIDQHVVQRVADRPCRGTGEGPDNIQEGMNIELQYNELTDVMFFRT